MQLFMVRYVGLEDSEEIQHTDNTADCDEVTFPPPGALPWSRLGLGTGCMSLLSECGPRSHYHRVQCTWDHHYKGPMKLKLGSRKVGRVDYLYLKMLKGKERKPLPVSVSSGCRC